jgi:DNA replication and repair protein RecF
MRVSRLALSDFRSYQDLLVEFPPGRVTLLGRNGAGKTNIVEAIRYLGSLSSHRVSGDAALVRAGANRAVLRATVEKAGRSLTLEVTITPGGTNAARLNSSPAKPKEVAGILRTVVFSPEDLDLVKGDPSGRRRFLDEVGTALAPLLAGDLSDYDRVLRQRSTLLKTARGKVIDDTVLTVWDEKLAGLGARITRARLDVVSALLPHVSREYSDVTAGTGPCSVRYVAAADTEGDFVKLGVGDIETRLRTAMEHQRAREIERGVCLVGPHRDDMEVRIGSLPARGYASHGESWSAALALRLGTYSLLTAEGGPDAEPDGEPVLILDDVFAELDATRRSALASRVSGAHQVIVTAAVEADVPMGLGGNVLTVEGGEVRDHGGR